MTGARPTTVLIAAMGGEGGGVLAGWIVSAAEAEGLAVQSTSIPGVAQRTGATTYYIELQDGGGRTPVMALYPTPGQVDVMVASELIEAGRAIQNGYVTPDCTTLIASTHRVYSMAERTAMGDARFAAARVVEAAEGMAQRAVLFDMEKTAREAGSIINSVLLGAIAGSGRLPIPVEAFQEAIRRDGKAVEANLAAFDAGLMRVREGVVEPLPQDSEAKRARDYAEKSGEALLSRIRRNFASSLHTVLEEGVNRLVDYQDAGYAALYLDRLEALAKAELEDDHDDDLVRETARWLALWMAYEDVARVAQIKLRPERFARIRADVGARPDQPLRIVEYFKPGVEEFAALMPVKLGRTLVRWAEKRGMTDRLHVGLHVPSTSIWGHSLMRIMAATRRWRRRGYRFQEEQALIDLWLSRIEQARDLDRGLALEIAQCARLLKGYGDTFRRGRGNFTGIMQTLVVPALAGEMTPTATAQAIARAREAALADAEGKELDKALNTAPQLSQAAE